MQGDNIDNEGVDKARQSLEVSQASQRRDGELLARADDVFATLRRQRIDNHWADKVGQLFRGVA